MSPSHQSQPIVMVERLANILTKSVSSASRGDAPPASVVGVGPEQVAHGSFVGYFLNSVNRTDVVERVDGRGESTVQAEDLCCGCVKRGWC